MSGTSKGNKQNLVQKLSTQTKDGLKIENQRLCKILNDLKKKYKVTYDVIHQLDQEYEQSKDNMVLRYPQLKQMIRQATTDHVIQQAEVPKIPKHKGVKDLFHSTEGTTQVQQPVASKSSSFLQTCKQFAGKSDDSSYETRTVTRNLSDMHKKEIEEDNRSKEHMISVYENKFLRAHNRLTKLKQEFIASKEDLPPLRYKKLKEMIKTVTKDEKLKPE
ncbi:uncharacterized protein LOC127709391 [Mytilus californianus]|uniref:uncharacterized protein LOC127709391 n=1 Tax=Mytilus californianus TaxID=6549 RepID=UPI0022466EC0|nr:uncharacterized protein LOC127709391 [Mytilus californianus]XP_052070857.1 uncharacterized protein LOC127709391 [Mytilus californianus]